MKRDFNIRQDLEGRSLDQQLEILIISGPKSSQRLIWLLNGETEKLEAELSEFLGRKVKLSAALKNQLLSI